MAIRYRVAITDSWPVGQGRASTCIRVVAGLTLAQAWRVCERAARRGMRRFGGGIVRNPWGMRGGEFPQAYRSATITATYR